MLKRLLAGAVLVVFAGQANAEIYSGNELIDEMREVYRLHMNPDRPSFLKIGFYYGSVGAAFDAYDLAGMLCTTDQVTLGQAIGIVSRYIKEHPSEWNLPAIDLARDALQSAFLCPK